MPTSFIEVGTILAPLRAKETKTLSKSEPNSALLNIYCILSASLRKSCITISLVTQPWPWDWGIRPTPASNLN